MNLNDMIDTIVCGDCLEVMAGMDDESIDMILCDLPYGTTRCSWDTIIPFEPLWEQYKRIIKPNGAIVLTASQPFTSALVMSNLDWFKYELIWDKNYGGAPGTAQYRPMPSHESILVFGQGRLTYNPQMRSGTPYTDIRQGNRANIGGNEHKLGYKNNFSIINKGKRYPLSVIRIQKYNQKGQHPTQKPVALFEYLILTYTNKGDLILDNCIGSGTTAVACIKTGRRFIGIDISEEYCAIARERIRIERMQPKFDFEDSGVEVDKPSNSEVLFDFGEE